MTVKLADIEDARAVLQDTINLTQQGVIVRTDRMKARRLMAAAGIPEMKIVATLGG